jgi:hypothetical protein
MVIEPPIIADNFGDVLFFRTVPDAEAYIEPIDARNNEYIVFDSKGRLLQITVRSRNKVSIESVESEPTHTSQLNDVLQKHLLTLGVPEEWLKEAELADLIAKRLEFKAD